MLTVTARIARTDQPGAPLEPLVLGLDGGERLGEGFRWQLEIAATAAVDPGTVLGQRALVAIRRAGDEQAPRLISAVVTAWESLGSIDLPGAEATARQAYSARLEPALARLEHDLGDGVLAGVSGPAAVEHLLAAYDHTALAVERCALHITRQRYPRQQVVRWREPTAAAVRRLLEEEGIFSYYIHQDGPGGGLGSHTLVLADTNQASAVAPAGTVEDPSVQELRRRTVNPVVEGVVRGRGDPAAAHRRLWRWTSRDLDGPSAVAAADHDYRRWPAEAQVRDAAERPLHLRDLGIEPPADALVRREFPAGMAALGDGQSFAASDAANRRIAGDLAEWIADGRAGEQLCRRRRLHGEGDHIGLQAGTRMSFAGEDPARAAFLVVGERLTIRPALSVASDPALDQQPALRDALRALARTAAEARWTRPAFALLEDLPQVPGVSLGWQGLGLEARCAVEALPLAVPFFPARSQPRPAPGGIHFATVVGADGRGDGAPGVHTDRLARVQVEFPWAPGQPTGWIRVVQAQAGAGGGMLAVPRIGDEVAVAFAWDGSDQPVVLGGLFGDAHLPPHDPSAAPARTVWRSRRTGAPPASPNRVLPGDLEIDRVPRPDGGEPGWGLADPGRSGAEAAMAGWRCNELSLDDTAGAERADLFAARGLNLSAGEDLVVSAGRRLVLEAGELLCIRVGNTMLTMEHGELKLGVYNTDAPSGSAALSISPLDLVASAPVVSLTGLMSASMRSSGSGVATELAGVSIAGASIEATSDLFAAACGTIEPVSTLIATGAVSPWDTASYDRREVPQAAFNYPTGSVVAQLVDEALVAGALMGRLAVLSYKSENALGSATMACIGGTAEIYASPFSPLAARNTIAAGVLGGLSAAFAEYPSGESHQDRAANAMHITFKYLADFVAGAALATNTWFRPPTAHWVLGSSGGSSQRSLDHSAQHGSASSLTLDSDSDSGSSSSSSISSSSSSEHAVILVVDSDSTAASSSEETGESTSEALHLVVNAEAQESSSITSSTDDIFRSSTSTMSVNDDDLHSIN
ncbi:MAG: type VI secretion system Vgr family protein [Planctomycetes bacterium]|nr:type VI secretion system Vgr family protein [Planctomycetota bacterium]